ncbi:hypothetical protein SB847_21565, partial [Bacillus sp. SIMBA_026]|uniref:hypothetical protein n=1 Tax=Bacillus sp. SIMBA_026 TaxID=3085769 RepID=UPI003978C3B7
WCAFLGGAAAFVYFVGFSDSAKQAQEEQRAQDAADAKPHVIREADGCKVYAFKAGDNWHYFTRCGDGTVTTERNWTETRRDNDD